MKYLLFVLALVTALPAFAQSADEIKGFRNFEFGSSPDKLPKDVSFERTEMNPKWLAIEIKGQDLAEQKLFGLQIAQVTLSYWDNRLYGIEIHLADINCNIPPSREAFHSLPRPEIDAEMSIYGGLKKAYGDPSVHEPQNLKGTYSSEWNGKSVKLWEVGHRDVGQMLVVAKFTVGMSSIAIEAIMDAETIARNKQEAAVRKDGL